MFFCIFFYIAFLLVVNAMHNVTVDDNDPSITYQPPSSWEVSIPDVLDAGGEHHDTSDPDATASFTFTGVAIYFYSPLWTYQVTTLVTLDDSPPSLLDLRDYTQPLVINGPETAQSNVVWSQTGLANTQHTLLVSVGSGQSVAVLDTLVYTVLDANDLTSSSSSSSSSSSTSSASSLLSSTSSPNPSAASENSSNKGLAVTLGVVCTVFGLLVISGIWWFVRRGRRRDDDYYDYPQTSTTTNDANHSPQMSNIDTNTTPAYFYSSSRSISSPGRDSRPRSIPPEIAAVTNARRTSSTTTRPGSSSIRHSTYATVTPSKLKNSLTPIPETLRETSLAQHTSTSSKSPVQDRRQDSLSSPSSPHDEREEAWTFPRTP